MNNHPVRVRYAPSPTGYPHVGNIRTALFNWLYARHTGGSFIVRIEDTDQARSIEGALQNILESLQWLGLDWDEGPQVGGSYGPYLQSQRLDLYHRAVREMVEQGRAYHCYCTPQELDQMRKEQQKQGQPPRYDRRCRDHEYAKPRAESGVVRFATPLEGPPVTTHDLIRGEVTVDLSVIDDFVILKSDDFPTYHLANVVDDHEMRISHVMRAEEWLPSTPRHLLLYEALGYQPPAFAHMPMILGPDRAKLSKRHGAASLLEFRDLGYLPDAMVNFLVLLGWSLDDKTEVFSREDLIQHFSLERVGKSPAIFNMDKLEWMNGVYIRGMPREELAEHLSQALKAYIAQHGPPGTIHLDQGYLMRIAPLLHERFKKLSPEEVWGLTSFFLVEDLDYAVPLTPKGLDKDGTLSALRAVIEELRPTAIVEFDVAVLEGALRSLAERLGLKTGQLFGAVRLAVTGSTAAPPLFDTLAVLGKDRVMKRLSKAVSILDTSTSLPLVPPAPPVSRHRTINKMTARRKDTETIREEVVNVLLAQLLRERGFSARAERRSRRGVPDVRVDLRSGDLVLLECKWEGNETLLESQLDERLATFAEPLGVIGVLYPDRLRHAENTQAVLEAATDLRWWLHGSRGAKANDRRVRSGAVAELADYLRTLPLQLEGVDRVTAAANAVGYALEDAAKRITSHARISRRVADIIASTDQEKDRAAALRIGCLVLFNALAFQDRLAAANEDVPTVDETLGQGIHGLGKAWRDICDNIDYVPVFELATIILDVLGDGPEETQRPVIDPLVRAMEETRRLEGHDLSGRLFHTLLTDAKFKGAYYTSVPAATMLSRLVFHDWPPHVDWSDHEFPASLNVADLACGTGTLLMAVAAEAERRHTDAGGRNAPELHKAMVEQALHGYDVQLSAIHFAATSLAMLNPDIQFDRMNLYVMPLGAEGSNVNLGSLDFLGQDEAPVQYALSEEEMGVGTREAGRVSGRGSRGTKEGITAKLPELDLAIMNPPFTRSVIGNLLFGSLPASERRRLQDELSRRLKTRQGMATAGLGAAFVAAATPKLRPGEGRLALVLPVTVCTGPSWEQTRSLIQNQFRLDMVITSHDPLRWNFSDSTDLSEALLIATRRREGQDVDEHRTTFVNLWNNPDGVLDAHRIAQAITSTTPAILEETGTALLEVDGRHIGEVLSMRQSRLKSKQWSGVQFARADLVRSALRLLDGGEVWIPGELANTKISMCPLNAIGQIGPDVRRLSDGFDRTNSVTAYPLVEGHNTELRTSLTCSNDGYLAPLTIPRGGQRRVMVTVYGNNPVGS